MNDKLSVDATVNIFDTTIDIKKNILKISE